MLRVSLIVALAVLLAACRREADSVAPATVKALPLTAAPPPHKAGQLWAATEENVAVVLPSDLSYCLLPDDRNGIDRAQTFFLTPPRACDRAATGTPGSVVPSINIYVVSSLLALEQLGRFGEPHSALDLARAACANAEVFADILILQRPAVGCRREHGDTINVTLFAVSDIPAPGWSVPARPTIALRLSTTRSRLPADWRVLRAIGAGAYVCGRTTTGRGRVPTCPPDGPW